MDILKKLNNQHGSTLVEAMISIFILTVGVIGAMAMQLTSVQASSSALTRTNANNVATSLLETLKELNFNDPNLNQTDPALVQDNNDRTFTAGAFPEMQSLIQVPAGAPAGTIVDQSRTNYQLSWDVQDVIIIPGQTMHKNIRVYMSWRSLLGTNRLEMTTIKYRNISL